MQGLSEPLQAELARLVPAGTWTDRSWSHGESEVWELSGQRTVFVKRHRSRRKHQQELRAYQDWLPALPAGAHPRLLAHAPGVLVIEGLSGGLLQDLPPDDPRLPGLYEQAGRWLHRLHTLPFEDDDPLPVPEALRRRMKGWVRRAAGSIDPQLLAEVERPVHTDVFAGVLRVRCHRDFSPRNLLVDGDALAVIDLEHARPDVALVDLVKLYTEPFVGRPDLQEAFHRGYGRPLSARERLQLDVLIGLYGIGTVVWARDHGDPAFEAHGRRMLDGLERTPVPGVPSTRA